uniref:NADH-ubiquinone oxidoreductase chain 4L n=1 Tax=Tettigades lacertosa TaxID=1986886 RepID=A0A3Q8GBK0_9HEMI|nr:NADH dehydrogenase subunit 4L [Tettigades lacertosa]
MNMSLFCYLMMYCSGVVSLCLARKHVMLSLLSLEFIILSLFCVFGIIVVSMISESYMMLMFLTFSVCEGVTGLSILVTMIRSHGNDHLSSMNLSVC